MSAFTALCWKEWRDARATLAVAFAAVVPLSFGFHALLPDWLHGEWTAIFALALLPTLFILVLAGDLISGDARGGRLATLRSLPVSPLAALVAKLVWLTLASVLFLGWCFVLQFPVLAYFGVEGAPLVYANTIEDMTPLVLLGVALGTGALFASSLAVGGLKAMFVSVLLVGLPLAVGLEFGWDAQLPLRPGHLSLYALAFTAAALVAVAFTCCHGRLHLGARWRPALVGWTTLGLCVLPSAGLASFRTARWLSLGPDSPRMSAVSLSSSPDGRFVAVQAIDLSTRGRRPVDPGHPTVMTVWIVNVETSALEVLPGRNWEFRRWSEEGELYLTHEAADGYLAWDDARAFDPETMTFGESRVDPHELTEAWRTFPAWARKPRPECEGDPVSVLWEDRGLSEVFFGTQPWHVAPQQVPGVVLHYTECGGLVRGELGVGRTTLVESGVERTLGPNQLSTDDRFVLAEVDGASVVLDAHTGDVVAGPWPHTYVGWLHDAPQGRFVLVGHLQPRWRSDEGRFFSLVDLDTGVELELGRLKAGFGTIRRLPDGRLVVLRHDGSIELLAPDGTPLRRLLGQRFAASNTERVA